MLISASFVCGYNHLVAFTILTQHYKWETIKHGIQNNGISKISTLTIFDYKRLTQSGFGKLTQFYRFTFYGIPTLITYVVI